MPVLKRLCVFCGSSSGNDPAYTEVAGLLGAAIARAGIELVYGGASVGLMGVVADAALHEGGRVTGVLPQSLKDKELAHAGLTELHIVESMHQRKAMMAELSDGFIALPGGVGTLEEIFEVWTWGQLGYHRKPCAVLNVAGFHDALIQFLDHVCERQFMKQAHRDMLVVADNVPLLLDRLREYEPPAVAKWIKAAER